MNKTSQFWALLKFQGTINPFIWFMLLLFGLPLFFISFLSHSYHPDLVSLLLVLNVQNLFLVGLFGLWTLAPEIMQSCGLNTNWNPGTEFLLTRAIDRSVLYRARTALFYLMVFALPLVSLFQSLNNPDVKVTENSKLVRQECLSHIPGASLDFSPGKNRSPLISIPRGNVLVKEWLLWLFATAGVIVQVALMIIFPLKHRFLIYKFLLMIFIFSLILGPVFFILNQVSYLESFFFVFVAHQAIFWVLTAIALILCQLWCEHRFCRLEQ